MNKNSFIYRVKKCFPILLICSLVFSTLSFAENSTQEKLPTYLKDRGRGMATSMFGTYIRHKEIIVYPFYEFYYNHDEEYDPSEMDFSNDEVDYEGRFVGHEGLLYGAIGITRRLMFEFEVAGMYATLYKADNDTSTMPDTVHEDGLGDVEGQIRWRYNFEKEKIPEFFNYLEIVLPLQKDRLLIGTSAWEFKLGLGIVKGFKFGTMTARFAVEYDGEDEEVAPGEYALEYLKKFSDRITLFFMFEGDQDEVEFVPELQIHFNKYVGLKINAGIGVTPKATDIAPETGFMFSYRFGGDK